MSLSCPTNNSSRENFWIPFFDDKELDIELKKKSQMLIIEYLQSFRLLKTERICSKCGNDMSIKWKNGYFWRCPKRNCQAIISVRSDSEFFSFQNNKNRISLFKILKLLEYYLMQTPIPFSVQKLNLDRKAVYDWRSLFRDPPYILFDRAEPMGGLGELCQVDEILLRGKRKNNKGRYTIGDLEGKQQESDDEDDDYEEHRNMRNYGDKVDGPWIFGISWYRNDEWKLNNRRGLLDRISLKII
ncbi:unnamed protein product [Meloidogyne enterolobii]|uniref:Uncharacterized protein n=1 Tax=Meloidogyne enterolobii TaxID=390850 RepID=A0ACB0Y0Q8_MELEN